MRLYLVKFYSFASLGNALFQRCLFSAVRVFVVGDSWYLKSQFSRDHIRFENLFPAELSWHSATTFSAFTDLQPRRAKGSTISSKSKNDQMGLWSLLIKLQTWVRNTLAILSHGLCLAPRSWLAPAPSIGISALVTMISWSLYPLRPSPFNILLWKFPPCFRLWYSFIRFLHDWHSIFVMFFYVF